MHIYFVGIYVRALCSAAEVQYGWPECFRPASRWIVYRRLMDRAWIRIGSSSVYSNYLDCVWSCWMEWIGLILTLTSSATFPQRTIFNASSLVEPWILGCNTFSKSVESRRVYKRWSKCGYISHACIPRQEVCCCVLYLYISKPFPNETRESVEKEKKKLYFTFNPQPATRRKFWTRIFR